MGSINDLIGRLDDFSKDVSKLGNASAKIKPDHNNMIEKECPQEFCLSTFLVNIDDWQNILRDEQVFCPICETPDLAKNFHSSRHLKEIKNEVAKSLKKRWTDGTPIKTEGIEITSSGESNHLYSCNSCSTRFGTLVHAQVCPSCGGKIGNLQIT